MTNQEITLITEIVKGLIGLAVLIATPYAIKIFKAVEASIQKEIGTQNFEFLKNYLLNEYSLHKDLFTPDKIAQFTEEVIVKFGGKISEDTIKRVIALVASGITDIK